MESNSLSKSRKAKRRNSIEFKSITSSEITSSLDLNRGSIPKESDHLKAGQRYVDDLELNEIFSNFKNTQKTNKTTACNNITLNDIRKFRAEN